MSKLLLTGLVSGDALRPVYSAKSNSRDEKTISAATPEALKLKIEAEEADGWQIIRRNKTSVRFGKEKPVDRQLEDDVWCLLHNMGFKELNFDRNFTIQIGEAPPRQIDVFAKDDETVNIVECTHAQAPAQKSLKSLIDKICAMRDDVIKAIQNHYGRDQKLKVKFSIATRNIEWRSADKDRAASAGIKIITDDDLNYFSRLTDLLKHSARYQFLGRYFDGDKVSGLQLKVPATRGKIGEKTFYNFLISPHELLRISFISHKAKSSSDDLDTYQRMVKPTRLKAIGRYIDEGGTFPTNIVINFKQDNLQFDLKERFGDTATGTLTLPSRYGAAWVIDGQHRLYGYSYASRSPENDHSVVSVLAYVNLPVREEIELFVDINTQQVKVNGNLVKEIVSSLNLDDPDPKKRLDSMCARVALTLDDLKDSPLRNRILTVSQDKSRTRCLTLTSLSDGIAENNLLGQLLRTGKASELMIAAGPLTDPTVDAKKTIAKSTKALSAYFTIFSSSLEDHWNLGDDKGGYLCTNLGLRALVQLFRRLIAFIQQKDEVTATTLEAEELVERIHPYVKPIISYFKSANPGDIARFRNRGSSLTSVDQNCLQLMAIIHQAIPEFNPKDLRIYIENQDTEGTKLAKNMIDEVNLIVFNDVLSRLKDKYGQSGDSWWMKGVPKNVRNECDRLYNENDGEHDRWQYMYLVNYSEIVLFGENWDLFKDHYNFYGKGKKADLVRWIAKLNKCRQITHHAEKGPLSRDQVDFVREVHELVKRFIEARQAVTAGERYLPE